MKYLFVLLSVCLILGAFTGCDKESDFEKDYTVYRESLEKKKGMLQEFLNKHQNDPFYYEIYLNDKFLTTADTVRIDGDLVYIDGNFIFSIADFFGYENGGQHGYAIFFSS